MGGQGLGWGSSIETFEGGTENSEKSDCEGKSLSWLIIICHIPQDTITLYNVIYVSYINYIYTLSLSLPPKPLTLSDLGWYFPLGLQ